MTGATLLYPASRGDDKTAQLLLSIELLDGPPSISQLGQLGRADGGGHAGDAGAPLVVTTAPVVVAVIIFLGHGTRLVTQSSSEARFEHAVGHCPQGRVFRR